MLDPRCSSAREDYRREVKIPFPKVDPTGAARLVVG